MKEWIFARLGENSTWRGLILLAGLLGAHLEPNQKEAFVGAALAIIALINVFRTSTIPGGEFNPNAPVKRPLQ
jgi:hypothetical protein